LKISQWQDLDDRAVAISRALAMDAAQKVGNGHPGTAMSLAPVAYTLFQRIMRHDPAHPNWLARSFYTFLWSFFTDSIYSTLSIWLWS